VRLGVSRLPDPKFAENPLFAGAQFAVRLIKLPPIQQTFDCFELQHKKRHHLLPKECTHEPVGENRGKQAGDGEVSEKSHRKQVKGSVDSIPKTYTWLPDGARA